MRKVSFHPNWAFWQLNLASLERVASLSRELTAWPDCTFRHVVLQLSWPFSFLRASHVWHFGDLLVMSQSQDPVARLFWMHTTWIFFTLSHTQSLHNSHLNTGYLIAKIQANLAQNKANTWLNKFNLTKMNYHILISSFFGNEVVASLLLRFKKSQCCTKTQNNTKDWNLEKKNAFGLSIKKGRGLNPLRVHKKGPKSMGGQDLDLMKQRKEKSPA